MTLAMGSAVTKRTLPEVPLDLALGPVASYPRPLNTSRHCCTVSDDADRLSRSPEIPKPWRGLELIYQLDQRPDPWLSFEQRHQGILPGSSHLPEVALDLALAEIGDGVDAA